MKSFNLFFGILLLACLALSFTAPNNFAVTSKATPKTAIGQDEKIADLDTVSYEELYKLVGEELIQPITKCMEDYDPHLFMTKCYSRVVFELSPRQQNGPIYTHQPIKGSLVFVDCSDELRLADVIITYESKDIKIKESFKSPQKDTKAYIKDLCEYITKNGIPHN